MKNRQHKILSLCLIAEQERMATRNFVMPLCILTTQNPCSQRPTKRRAILQPERNCKTKGHYQLIWHKNEALAVTVSVYKNKIMAQPGQKDPPQLLDWIYVFGSMCNIYNQKSANPTEQQNRLWHWLNTSLKCTWGWEDLERKSLHCNTEHHWIPSHKLCSLPWGMR